MTWFRRIALLLGVLVLLAAAALAYLLTTDLGRFRPQIEAYVSESLGRPFAINGRFEPRLGKVLELLVEDVTLANAEWGHANPMLALERGLIRIDAWSLVSGPLRVLEIDVSGLTAHVESDPETGASSWDLGNGGEEGRSAGWFSREGLALIVERASASDVDITYGRGWLAEPRKLLLSAATLAEDDESFIALDARGEIDAEALSASGSIGPMQALLTGRDLQWALDINLGNYRALTEGRFHDAFALDGPAISATVTGPSAAELLERLGLPPLASGAINVRAAVREAEDGLVAEIDGAFGDLQTRLAASAPSLRDWSSGSGEFDVRGPDLRAVAKLFGVGHLPPDAFSAKGAVTSTGDALELADVLVAIGGATLSVDGRIGVRDESPSARLAVAARGPELQRFLDPAWGISAPAGAFEATAVLAGNASRLRIVESRLRVSDYVVDIDGTVDGPGTRNAFDVKFAAAGPDLAAVAKPWVDLTVPTLPFAARGGLRSDGTGLDLDALRFEIGGATGTVDGKTGKLSDFDGLRLDLKFEGPDASRLRTLLQGLEERFRVPAENFTCSGRITRDAGVWSADPWTMRIGEHRLEIRGALGDGSSLSGLDVAIASGGPDLRLFLPERDLPGPLPFEARGRVGATGALVDLTDFNISIGRATGFVSGRIPTDFELADAKFQVRLSGEDLAESGRLLGYDALPAGPFRLTGSVSRRGPAYVLDSLKALVAATEINGNLTYEFEPRRRLSGRIEAGLVDLARIFPPDPEPAKPPADGRLIPDWPLPVDRLGVTAADLVLVAAQLKTQRYDIGRVELRVTADGERMKIETQDVQLTRGGTLGATIDLQKQSATDARVALAVRGEQFDLKPPVDAAGKPIERPRTDLVMELTGRGASLRQLAATAGGKISARFGTGEIDNSLRGLLLRDVATMVFGAVNPFAKTSSRTRVQCGILEASVTDGVLRERVAGLQTDGFTAASVGTLNLANEKLDLSFRTRLREGVGVSLATAANPYIKLGGTLAKPAIELDVRRGLLTGTVAVLTGGLSILAQGIWDRYLAADDFCTAVAEGLASGEIDAVPKPADKILELLKR